MKKSLFAALTLAAAILLPACKGNEGQTAVTGISIRPTELTLNPGGSSRLSVSVTPENAKYNSDDIVWASSDTAVAVVSANGTVTALEVGTANITATLGEYKAACALTVNKWIDNLKFTGVYFGISDTSYYDAFGVDTIKSMGGDTYICKKVRAYVALFTAGFYLNEKREFAGGNEGGIVDGYAPIYWAPGWLNKSDGGIIFVLGSWGISDNYSDTTTQVIKTGKVNDLYIPNMKLFLEAIAQGDQETAFGTHLKAAGQDGCEGALLTHYIYHTTAEGYGSDGFYSAYIPELFFTGGYLDADNNYAASSVMCSIESHNFRAQALKEEDVDDNNFYAYGCYWHYDETNGYTWNDEEVHFADKVYAYEYNLENVNAGAPARVNKLIKITNFDDMAGTQKAIQTIRGAKADHKALK